MKNISLNFQFKGQRDYLHGPDIAFAVAEYIASLGGHYLDLSLNSFTRNEIFYFSGSQLPNHNKRIGYGNWSPIKTEFEKSFILVEGKK